MKPPPLVRLLLRRIARWRRLRALKGRSAEEIFTDVFRRNGWGGEESISGRGSDAAQTARVVAALPALFAEHRVRSILDIPCGDFHWMRTVDLEGIAYTGADVVGELIEQNQRYATENITFRQLNLLGDPLPAADLVLCRDCLVHFSFEDIFRALANVCASGSRLFLATTFPERRRNAAIVTGDWRPLNLQREPLGFPPPAAVIREGCTEWGGRYADKSLGLWRIDELPARLRRRSPPGGTILPG